MQYDLLAQTWIPATGDEARPQQGKGATQRLRTAQSSLRSLVQKAAAAVRTVFRPPSSSAPTFETRPVEPYLRLHRNRKTGSLVFEKCSTDNQSGGDDEDTSQHKHAGLYSMPHRGFFSRHMSTAPRQPEGAKTGAERARPPAEGVSEKRWFTVGKEKRSAES